MAIDRYIIEEVKEGDIDAIRNLIIERCNWFKEKGIKGWRLEHYPVKYNREYFLDRLQDSKLIVARLEDVVAGFVMLKDSGEYWIDSVNAYYGKHLASSLEYKGVGRILMEYTETVAKEDGREYVRLDCFADNPILNSFYKDLGYTYVRTGIAGMYYIYNLYQKKIL